MDEKNEGRKVERMEGRKEGRKESRKEGRKIGGRKSVIKCCKKPKNA